MAVDARAPAPPAWQEAIGWFLLALALRAGLALMLRFDGLWGQDPWGYLDQARGLMTWLSGEGPLPAARWPQGYPALGVGLHLLGTPLPRAMQLASLLCGAATVPLTLAAARAWWPGRAATAGASVSAAAASWGPRLAALLVLTSPVHVLWSMCATSDAAAVMWLAAAAWLFGAARRDGLLVPSRLAASALAGGSLALACSTRLAAGLAVPAFALVAVSDALAQPSHRGAPPRRGPGLRGSGLRGSGSWGFGLRALGAAAAAGLLAATPQLLLWRQAPAGSVAHPWLRGWRPWHALQRSFDTVDGAAHYRWPQAVFAAFPAIHPGYLGGFAAILAAAGVAALLRRRADAPPHSAAPRVKTAAFLLTWVGVAWLFFAGMPFQNYRFGLIALVPWALLTAVGAGELLVRKPRLAQALLAATLLTQGVWASRLIPRHVTMAAQRTTAARRLHAALPAEARVLAFGLTADLAGRSGRAVIELANVRAAALPGLSDARQRTFLLIDPDQIAQQWRDKPVGRNVAWLRQHRRWRAIHLPRTGIPEVDRWRVWRMEGP